MKKIIAPLLCIAMLSACNNDKKTEQTETVNLDSKFENYKNTFIEEIWRLNPGWATGSGYHKFDSILEIPNAELRAAKLQAFSIIMDSIKSYDENKLNSSNKISLWMMRDQVDASMWYINMFKGHEWDAANYNVGGSFADILNGTYDKLENRLHSINLKLNGVADYYKAARESMKNPTLEHVELSIIQNNGSISIFKESIIDSVKKSSLSEEEKKEITTKSEAAKAAIEAHIEWLNELKKAITPETARSFRIGKELYDQKFKHDIQSRYTAEEIYNRALKRKTELHSEMGKLSAQLWKKYFKDKPAPADTLAMIRIMIDELSGQHVHRDALLSSIDKQIPELVKFINDKNLIYIDPSKPLVVRKTPDYMEGGGAGASINAPGPYEKNANTYYNVSLLTNYSEKDAESYLREYNKYILQILNIHEAIPGHYTQLVYSNNSPDMIKSIFGNGAMVEGWAVYGERMMLENGYGNNEPEMWLMYYKWHLRSVCNTILDYSVHKLDMSKEDAIALLTKEAFQQEKEATNKWRRASLTQVQLCCYFTGFSEIYDLREEIKKIEGDKFDLKKFHEKFLSYGSAPVKYIRQLMLEDLKK